MVQEQERACVDCGHFRIGDAMDGGDGWCVSDVPEGQMEWKPVNDAEVGTCPSWIPVTPTMGDRG